MFEHPFRHIKYGTICIDPAIQHRQTSRLPAYPISVRAPRSRSPDRQPEVLLLESSNHPYHRLHVSSAQPNWWTDAFSCCCLTALSAPLHHHISDCKHPCDRKYRCEAGYILLRGLFSRRHSWSLACRCRFRGRWHHTTP